MFENLLSTTGVEKTNSNLQLLEHRLDLRQQLLGVVTQRNRQYAGGGKARLRMAGDELRQAGRLLVYLRTELLLFPGCRPF